MTTSVTGQKVPSKLKKNRMHFYSIQVRSSFLIQVSCMVYTIKKLVFKKLEWRLGCKTCIVYTGLRNSGNENDYLGNRPKHPHFFNNNYLPKRPILFCQNGTFNKIKVILKRWYHVWCLVTTVNPQHDPNRGRNRS
jgi:hypothetical protein